MNAIALVTKRNLTLNKSRSLTYIGGLTLAVTLTVIAASLCLCVLDYLLAVAGSLSGESAGALAAAGIMNLAEVIYTLFNSETASDFSADILFSAEALLQNTPIILAVLGLLTLLIAYLSVKITFTVGSVDRNRFYGLLLAAGANTRHLRKGALYETLYLCAIGIPAGLLLGTLGTFLTDWGFELVFLRMAQPAGIDILPVTLSPRPLALLIGVLFGFLAVLLCVRKSIRRALKHTVVEAIEDTDFVDLGLSSFTPDDGYYKVVGLEGHLGIRNYQSRIFRYLIVSFMMTAYVTVVLGTLYTFNIVRDYNSELFDGVVSSALVETDKTVAGMILVTEIAFCAAAALMSVTALTGTFNMMPLFWESLQKCRDEYGMNVTIIAGTDLSVVSGLAENSDAIITTKSSTGAAVAPLGQRFSDGYTPANGDSAYVSPSMTVDASEGYLPDNTWYIEGLFHGMEYKDPYTAGLMMKTLLTDDLADISTDPAYPRFHATTNPATAVFAAFDKSAEGIVCADDTALTIKNLSAQYQMKLLAVTCDGMNIKFNIGDNKYLEPGQSVTIPFVGTVPAAAKTVAGITVTYSLAESPTPVNERTFHFTVMNGEALSYDAENPNTELDPGLNTVLGNDTAAAVTDAGFAQTLMILMHLLEYLFKSINLA